MNLTDAATATQAAVDGNRIEQLTRELKLAGEQMAAFRIDAGNTARRVTELSAALENSRNANVNLNTEILALCADFHRVVVALREQAIERAWCAEYAEFVEEVNSSLSNTSGQRLLPATRKFTVIRTIEVRIEVEALDEDAATERADELITDRARLGDFDAWDSCDTEVTEG